MSRRDQRTLLTAVGRRVLGPLFAVLLVAVLLLPARAAAQAPTPERLKAELWSDSSVLAGWLARSDAPEGVPGSTGAWEAAPHDPGSATALPPAAMAGWARMAWQSFRNGNWEIYVARGDGSAPLRATTDPASDVHPALNRGATRLAFSSARSGGQLDLYSTRPDGTDLKRLTSTGDDEAFARWSPDGKRIAYARLKNDDWEIYTMAADGTGQRRVTDAAGEHDVWPTWSPDGKQIAWARIGAGGGRVMVMNADGSGARALTGALRYLGSVAWSPDGRYLAFDYDRDSDYWNELCFVDLASGSPPSTFLAFDPGAGVDAVMGAWSPDGRSLLFTRAAYAIVDGRLVLAAAHLGRVDLDTMAVSLLPGSGADMNPTWQTTDLDAPDTRVEALPAYSDLSGFTVQWSGGDRGPAGIPGYDIETRLGSTGEWTLWLGRTTATGATYNASPTSAGERVYFRSRAVDYALNAEPWPAATGGDASTMLYRWRLEGGVFEPRGRPVPGAMVTLAPAALNAPRAGPDGSYVAYLAAGGHLGLSAGRSGYAGWEPTSLSVTGHTSADLYLAPETNLLANGGFEADAARPAGWQAGGVAPPSVAADAALSGRLAARLGQTGLPSPANLSRSRYNAATPSLAFGADGTLHAAWADDTEPNEWAERWRLAYTRCPSGKPCEATQFLWPGNWPRLAVAADGTVHLIYLQQDATIRAFYVEKPAGGAWSEPAPFFPEQVQSIPEVVVDASGRLHAAWIGGVESWLCYSTRPAGGEWQPPQQLETWASSPRLLPGRDGTLHLLNARADYGTSYRVRKPDGSWEGPETVPGTEWKGLVDAALDGRGRVYAVWQERYHPYPESYAVRSEGAWSALSPIPGAASSEAALGVLNGDQVVFVRGGIPPALLYLMESGWSAPQPFGGAGWGSGWMALATAPDSNRLALAAPRYITERHWDVALARGSFRPEVDGASMLSQAVAVPPDMHRPTLAFDYSWAPQDGGAADRFDVIIGDAAGHRTVLEPPPAAGARHAWYDLDGWRGQTITVTFAVTQIADGRHAMAAIDNVSLGPWLTPVVTHVEPGMIRPGAAVGGLVVRGANFLPGASVRAGDTPLVIEAQVADALRVRLPAGLAVGVYDVQVTNPGGQAAVATAALRVGGRQYLPLAGK